MPRINDKGRGDHYTLGFKSEDATLYRCILLSEGRMDELAKKVKTVQEAEVEDKMMHSELKVKDNGFERHSELLNESGELRPLLGKNEEKIKKSIRSEKVE